MIAKVCGERAIGDAIGIGTTRNGVICGGVVFYMSSGANLWMHDASDGSRRWLSRLYLKNVFNYAFETCGAKRISGFIEAANIASIKFHEHLGFEFECALQNACKSGDLLIYKMFKRDCKWV